MPTLPVGGVVGFLWVVVIDGVRVFPCFSFLCTVLRLPRTLQTPAQAVMALETRGSGPNPSHLRCSAPTTRTFSERGVKSLEEWETRKRTLVTRNALLFSGARVAAVRRQGAG